MPATGHDADRARCCTSSAGGNGRLWPVLALAPIRCTDGHGHVRDARRNWLAPDGDDARHVSVVTLPG